MNKREMLREQLEEDVLRAKSNYQAWEESYKHYLSMGNDASLGLLSYYKTEAEVAYEVWQYKLKNFNRKFKALES